ncbi:MAG: hypothetical protein MK107_14740 [Oceanicola sp.]|nr:hypothetical protein [Oceanicola sp.]
MKDTETGGCGRITNGKDCFLTELSLSLEEQITLTLSRLFFQSFSEPSKCTWLTAFAEAEARFGHVMGPQVLARLLAALQAVRHARRSVFMFNNPDCPGCSRIVTEHERRLMMAIHLLRKGDSGRAQLEVMMLCEGNNVDHVMRAIMVLGRTLDEASMPDETHRGWGRLARAVLQ